MRNTIILFIVATIILIAGGALKILHISNYLSFVLALGMLLYFICACRVIYALWIRGKSVNQ